MTDPTQATGKLQDARMLVGEALLDLPGSDRWANTVERLEKIDALIGAAIRRIEANVADERIERRAG